MEPTVCIQVVRLPHGQNIDLPKYETSGSVGMDLCAAISEPLLLQPGHRFLVPTGIAVAIPNGYEAQVRPRSGLAIKNGLTCLNSPGTIDSDYRGEIKVIMINHGTVDFTIEPKMRIAQIIFAPITKITWKPVVSLSETDRGDGGFGHTGE